MRITDILRGIEKLVFELLLWIIFIPKTYFKIIAHPHWIRGYIDGELTSGGGEARSDGFDDYMSPVMLFLISSVLLFVIANHVEIGETATLTKIAADLRGTTGIAAGLGFLAMPVIFALLTEVWRRQTLTRDRLRRIVFIQCYYFTPPILSFFAAYLLALLAPVDAVGTQAAALSLMFGMAVWFAAAETRLIAQELQSGILKAVGVFVVGVLVLVTGAGFVDSWTSGPGVDDTISGREEAVDLLLPQNAPYTIVVTDFNGDVGEYELTLSGPPGAVSNPASAAAATRAGEATLRYGESVRGSTSPDAPNWTFYGNAGDIISVTVDPLDQLDIVFDIRDAAGTSVLTVDRSGLYLFLGLVYVVVVGWAWLRGVRSLFRRTGASTED